MAEPTDKELTDAAQRFYAPTSFNDSKTAPVIDGLTAGDEGYMEAWSKKYGIPFERVSKRTWADD